MSNEKLKSESYQQFGGINVKASPYILGPMEFLDIRNMDFQTPGSLTQRWGSTMYVSQTLPGKINNLVEFTQLDGTSSIIFGSSGGLWIGATTGTSRGMSFIHQVSYDQANNNYDIVYDGSPIAAHTNLVPYLGAYGERLNINWHLTVSSNTFLGERFSFVALNDNLFAANGNEFFKTNGGNISFVGLPPVGSNIIGVTVFNNAAATDIGVGATGSYAFYASYVNRRGFEGQIWPLHAINASQANSASLGGTFIQSFAGVYLPPEYDITSVNVYSYWAGASITMGSTITWNLAYTFLSNVTMGGVTLIGGVTGIVIPLGSTLGGQSSLVSNAGFRPDPVINSYYPLGFTLVPQSPTIDSVKLTSLIPRYLGAYQNRLFMAGFSTAPSTVWFSETGEPEGIPLENSFEVRTNDGDVISGMAPYSTRMFIFKRKSFHVLSGDTPANFFLQEVSGTYGAINSRCIIVYGENDQLLFLDRKGLISFNGAHPAMASFKMQPYFDRMNFNSAVSEACMVHDKLRSQVLCSIPIDGATLNNITIVYDYAVNAWTTYYGVAPAVLARLQGRNNSENAFYGSYSGVISWYGPSFITDSDVGFTCLIKTRFLHDMGDSVQKQFRRTYLNMDPPSATLNMNINFFQDYGSSKVLQTTLTISEFQARLDYGLSAKSLAFELYNMATNSPLKIHGFSVEERMQRRV